MVNITLLSVLPFIAVIFIVIALLLYRTILKLSRGTDSMKRISDYIMEGSRAYIKRQSWTISIFGIILAVIIYATIDIQMNNFLPLSSFAFILGVLASVGSGIFSMIMAANTNSRTTAAASKSRDAALRTAYRGGVVMGLVIMASSILGISLLFIIYNAILGRIDPFAIIAFGFGASFAALFAQLGGGIFTKAADVGADLVGKLEVGIPEDDPRNPGVIADNVGDAVGDCAGRGADLFESITGETIGAMIIGTIFYVALTQNNNATGIQESGFAFIVFPLIAGALSMLSTVVTIWIVKVNENEVNPMKPMKRAFYIVTFINFIVLAGLIAWLIGLNWFLIGSALIGLALGVVTLLSTEYYTSKEHRPVKSIAESSKTGAATNIITGLSIGFESTWIPVIGIVAALLSTFALGFYFAVLNPAHMLVQPITSLYGVEFGRTLWGVFAVTIGTISLLSTASMILALDGYGPITDQSGGIAEMAKAEPEIRERIDSLDAVGNTTKALAKGYGMTSAGLAALLLFQVYLQEISRKSNDGGLQEVPVNIANPIILSGLLLGALLPAVFVGLTLGGVGRAANKMVTEIRRQFKEIPGIMEGENDPDYAACVDVSTKAALKEMVAPSLLVLIAPVVVGFVLGPLSLAAFLIGATASGIILGLALNNGGGAWDNAKKLIETGMHGGKGSEAHKAAVVGDTVGDPAKDTSGPAIHVLIKLINTIALTLLPLFIVINGIVRI